MLQQTQVSRVEGYFRDWMNKYPSWKALARAPLREVLLSWQGLGYNRRGKYLHDIAQVVSNTYGGRLPSDRKLLEALPGIGHYTAGSIRAFAFDIPDEFLETNIRTVLFYHFYTSPTPKTVSDSELLGVLEKYIAYDSRARAHPREFYYALMDYGAYLKQRVGNLNKQSKSYTKQSRFEGSRRQLRAGILRYVLHNGPVNEARIVEQSHREEELVRELLCELVKEGSITKHNNMYQ